MKQSSMIVTVNNKREKERERHRDRDRDREMCCSEVKVPRLGGRGNRRGPGPGPGRVCRQCGNIKRGMVDDGWSRDGLWPPEIQ